MPTPSSYAFSHRNAATELLFLFLPFSFGGGESSLPISFPNLHLAKILYGNG